jgi:hypothetical protein
LKGVGEGTGSETGVGSVGGAAGPHETTARRKDKLRIRSKRDDLAGMTRPDYLTRVHPSQGLRVLPGITKGRWSDRKGRASVLSQCQEHILQRRFGAFDAHLAKSPVAQGAAEQFD